MASLMKILLIVLVPALGLVLGWLVRDVLKKMSGSGLILLSGLAALFLGERMLGVTDWRLPVSVVGLLIVLGAVGLRAFAMAGSTGDRARAHRQALVWTLVVVGGLALYGLTLETLVDAIGLDEEATARWEGVWNSLFPIVVLVGLLPVFMLDRVLAVHPRVMPTGATLRATTAGLSAALSVALVFPVNYLAAQHSTEWDVAYFRTTRPGTSTQALVGTLTEPVEAVLFFAAGSDVGREVAPYFDALAAASGGQLTVRQADQALEPVLSEELKIRDNGYVALRQGESIEKFKVGTELDAAKRELKKLDATVQEHFIKLTRGARTVYLLVGHGEASSREKDEPLRKLNLFKKEVLESQNFKVKNLGVTEGSAVAVPDDAAAVIVAAPETPLLPEELTTLKAYWEGGGRLFVLLDPESDKLPELLATLGVEAGDTVLAHDQAFISQNRGLADRVLLVSNKFGSHESTKTLSRNSTQLALILPTVVSVQKAADTDSKVTTLVRSFPDTWADTNGNRQPDPSEERKVYDIAVAVTPAAGEGRAVVVGDVNVLSDPVLGVSKGNAIFAVDSLRWLVGDESIAGETESEEDVKIVHTRDEDQLWFYATTFAIPLLVLGFGVIVIQFRRRKS